jgi:vacuolar-type H+-ATPase subunit E/Vma4
MKELENKIQKITGNKKFKISSKTYYHPIKNMFNDLLSNLSESKIIEHQIKRNQNNTKIKLLNLIEELCNNDKFYKLIDDDIPCLKSILDYIDEHNNNETILNDVIKFIEKWLDECSIIITKKEDCFSLLNEQFKIYYETNLTD